MLDLPLADDGLADTANVRLPGHRRNIHQDLQRDFAPGVHLGRDVDVYADIKILELCIHQRINAHTSDTGLE